jgi:hypothetical protein
MGDMSFLVDSVASFDIGRYSGARYQESGGAIAEGYLFIALRGSQSGLGAGD